MRLAQVVTLVSFTFLALLVPRRVRVPNLRGDTKSSRCRETAGFVGHGFLRDGVASLEITEGPDHALWFTNSGNDSDRPHSMDGDMTHVRHSSIDNMAGAGRWARRSPVVHESRQGTRSTHVGPRRDQKLQAREHPRARGHRRGQRRRTLVHQRRQRHDRADLDRRLRSRNSRHASIVRPRGITSGPDGALWFTNRGNTRSDESPPPASSPHPGTRASAARGGSPPGRTARSGSPTTGATTRSGGSRQAARSQVQTRDHPPPAGDRAGWTAPSGSPTSRSGSIGRIATGGKITTSGREHPRTLGGSRSGRTAPCGSPTGATTRSGGSRAGAITNFRARGGHPRSRSGIVARPRRCAVVYQRGQRVDRADHHARHGQQPSGRPASRGPEGGIVLGPDGALWFANGARGLGENRSGDLDQGGSLRTSSTRASAARRDRGRAGRALLVHQLYGKGRSGGSRPRHRDDFTTPSARAARRSLPARTAHLVHQPGLDRKHLHQR